MPRGNHRIETTGLGAIGRIRRIFCVLMSVYHVLFDMKAGMSFPGLYAFSDWRSWSRGYV